MERKITALAVILSVTAIVLAMDPGRFAFQHVDVGGHELRMFISGQGGPAVVFEAGGSTASGGPLEAWELVQPAVSKFATTVSYDRAGIGWSNPGPKPRDARQVAHELHTALQNSHVPPPYVLVGHSFGGPLNRVFADLYPGDVAGLVLLDPTQEEFIDWNMARDTNRVDRLDDEWKDIMTSLAEAHASRVPDGIPVVVVTGMGPRKLLESLTEAERKEVNTFRPMWLKYHKEWVEKLPKGRHIITENSGHGVPFEEPALVVKVIREVVEQARK